MGFLMEARANRQLDQADKQYEVMEVVVADVEKALEANRGRLQEDAREAEDSKVFIGGMKESLEEVENEMETEAFAGGLQKGLDQIMEQMEMGD